jgi:hypothetical protein
VVLGKPPSAELCVFPDRVILVVGVIESLILTTPSTQVFPLVLTAVTAFPLVMTSLAFGPHVEAAEISPANNAHLVTRLGLAADITMALGRQVVDFGDG